MKHTFNYIVTFLQIEFFSFIINSNTLVYKLKQQYKMYDKYDCMHYLRTHLVMVDELKFLC